jgi:glycosyltransferase involved in cell wall biosynthesis
MPCLNGVPFIQDAVDSVLRQTYPNVELIVVDDGSGDGSVEIVKRLSEEGRGRISLLFGEGKGPYPARNAALAVADGEFVAFLDADDYWDSACLEKLHAALTENEADVAYCGWQNVGDNGPGNKPFVPPQYEKEDLFSHLLKSCPWPIHAALARRDVVDDVGGFSERCFTSMDYDFWLKIAARTQKLVRVPEVLAYYRWHNGGQISANRYKQVLDSWRVRRDFVESNRPLVSHLSRQALRDKTDGVLLQYAYRAYWDRDLVSAQRLFRKAIARMYLTRHDLKYVLPSLLPGSIYRSIVKFREVRS